MFFLLSRSYLRVQYHDKFNVNMDFSPFTSKFSYWCLSPKEGEEKEHLSGSRQMGIWEWTPFIPASVQDQYKFVSINLIKQWRSGCLGNHWEQVAVVKIDFPVGAEAASFPLSFTRHLSVVISLASQKSRG